ncbi:MAG: S41 family peptidase [Vicingaceae bacterium]
MGRATLLLTSLLLVCLISFSQSTNYGEIAADITKTAEKFHYNPRPLNAEFSALVFEQFTEEIDPLKLLLSIEDYQKLKAQSTSIHQAIFNKESSFIDSSVAIINEKVNQTLSHLKTLDVDHFDFSQRESISLKASSVYLDEAARKQKWKKLIKSRILLDYFAFNDSTAKNQTEFEEYFKEELPAEVEQIICQLEDQFLPTEKLETHIASKYLQSIASAYDPHTSYFNESDEAAFSRDLSKEALSFGMEIHKNREAEFEVVHLVPGGPAWSSNLINEGDILEGIKSDEETIDLSCISPSDFYERMNSLEHGTFIFTKSGGVRKKVELFKKKIEVQDNVINSYILKGERKVGYLYLPSFYTEDTHGNGLTNGCANDIAKELVKLKRERIEGLIIDLRNNGGGSLLEAVRLSGIFINYGALGIMDERDQKPVTLKDMDRGSIYSKPLLILVNRYSASASEFFAAAMQDHQRGVVVGENTFGKATSQQVIPVDMHQYNLQTNPSDINTEKGYLKVTSGKLYRVNGISHQNTGVSCDIQLSHSTEKYGEALFPTALKSTTIEKKTYYTPLNPLPITALKEKSRERNSPQKTKKELRLDSIPLSFEEFKNFYTAYTTKANASLEEENGLFQAIRPPYVLSVDSRTAKENKIQKDIINSIENDEELNESYQIINDLIHLNDQ